MIRLLILLLGLFVFWVLFYSGLKKQQKIIISLAVFLLAGAGAWFEGYGETPRFGLIMPEQVVVCAVSGQHSYRTNYQIEFCLENQARDASVARLELRFFALLCTAGECFEADSVNKQLNVELLPHQRIEKTANLPFNKIVPEAASLTWKVDVVSVKAIKIK